MNPMFKNAEKLSCANTEYYHFLKSFQQTALSKNKLSEKLLKLPMFINDREQEDINKFSVALLNIFKRIPASIFNNDLQKIYNFYGIYDPYTQKSVKLTLESGLNTIIGRGDFVQSESGFKCLEYNITSNLGGLEYSEFSESYLSDVPLNAFLENKKIKVDYTNIGKALLRHLIESCFHSVQNLGNEINIAVIYPEHTSDLNAVNYFYEFILKEFNPNFHGKIFYLRNTKGLYVENDKLYYHQTEIHGLMDRGNKIELSILELVTKKMLCVVNGAGADFLSNKRNLALLSEHQKSPVFTEEEQQIIQQYIPWTRLVKHSDTEFNGEKVQLLQYVSQERKNLVLKAVDSARGEAVFVGNEVSQKDWDTLLLRALKRENWIVQEYIHSVHFPQISGDDREISPHRMVWGFFTFGNRYGGSFLSGAKTTESSVVNTSKPKVFLGNVFNLEY